MKKLTEYIETSFESMPNNKQVYKFRRDFVDELTERANELTAAGLKDENVIDDLIISEHPDIKAEYAEIENEIKQKKKRRQAFILKIVGSFSYFIALIVIYLLISFLTHDWKRTWIFPINGLSLYFAYLCITSISKLVQRKSIFRPVSRILLGLSVYLFAIPIFIIAAVIFKAPHSWLIFIVAALVMMIADSIFAEIAAERFAIIFHILYIVPFFALLYVILGVLYIIPWHPGWLMIPGSLVIVAIVIFWRILIHNNDKSEEMEDNSEWNEN